MPFNLTFIHVLIIWNIFTLALMGIDKYQAVHYKWRISEKTIFTFPFFFGGIGILVGMFLFHHKTKHWSFRIFVPLSIVFNILIFYYFK